MTKKYLNRAFVWSIMVIVFTFVTIANYRIFITNQVKKDIAKAETVLKDYEGNFGKIQLAINKINKYNEKVYDDNKYSMLIPDNFDSQEIISKYVKRPILLSNGELLSMSLTEEMPSSIIWSKEANKNNIKGVKVTVTFTIDVNNVDLYLNQLQSSVRCLYFGDFNYTMTGENAPSNEPIQVMMSYYLFYRDVETT